MSTHDLMAFFWCRGGQRLVYAALDQDAGCARWYRCDLGTDDPSDSVEQELAAFWPSRDQLFLLHFFEQFAASHRIIDPSGRWLTWASHPEPGAEITDFSPRIMALDLTSPDPDPIVLAPGSFAVFSPPPGTG
ncbi:MAG: hypothetical protein GXP62_05265 [Oligoflexia bacterium]|nr:hypothetical protein [Oligoflexia bacterium]